MSALSPTTAAVPDSKPFLLSPLTASEPARDDSQEAEKENVEINGTEEYKLALEALEG